MREDTDKKEHDDGGGNFHVLGKGHKDQCVGKGEEDTLNRGRKAAERRYRTEDRSSFVCFPLIFQIEM